jgi:ribosomal protein S12 methylthiotransferase
MTRRRAHDERPRRSATRTIHFVALGCPKNRVDTERMIGIAQQLGHELVADAARADVIVVNTCGFILRAKEESIETVLELAAHKRRRCRTLIMAGCLAQRHPEELAQELPEVDHFIGTADLPALAEILASHGAAAAPRRVAVGQPGAFVEEAYERTLVGSPHMAYLKIAEGCDRRCAFCVIPQLRGRQRSRTLPSLLAEAEQLCAAGARELVLVAQDTTAWGRDLARPADPRGAAEPTTLTELLRALDALGERSALRWIRLLYAYVTAVDAPLVSTLAELPRVVPYLDLPFQHIDDGVLRRMRRGYGGERVRRVIRRLRRTIPGVFLRGTIIAGHPGESRAAHRALLDFVAEAELEHLGVFPFSPEEGTAAAAQPDPVPSPLAEERAAELMALQRKISRRKLRALRGQTIEVLVDGPSDESELLLEGRHAGQAPEVDGGVVITDLAAPPGTFVRATVTDSGDYDLVASGASSVRPGRSARGVD